MANFIFSYMKKNCMLSIALQVLINRKLFFGIFFCSAVEGNERQIKQHWLFSPLEKLLYIWLRVILCLLIHIITRSVSNVNVEILYPDCPTWHCFFHVSRFFRWALEKWSHDFCLVTVVNMFSICSTLNEIHNHHPRYIGQFIQSVAPHCLHTDKPK